MTRIITASLLLAFAASAVNAMAAPRTDENEYWTVENKPRSDCVIDGKCIMSHRGAGRNDYDDDEMCTFTAKESGTVHTIFFRVKNNDDLVMDGVDIHAPAVEVDVGSELIWNSNRMRVNKGFRLCYGAPSQDENDYWAVSNAPGSDCVIDGKCIKSHRGAGMNDYENDEMCTFTAKKAGTVHTIFFRVKNNDDLTMYGDDIHDPAVEVEVGTELIWNSNRLRVNKGFQLCYGAPSQDENDYWAVLNAPGSDCVIDGPCLKSHAGAGTEDYMNYEYCDFTAKMDGNLRAMFFATEVGYDELEISGQAFSGSASNNNHYDNPLYSLSVTQGTTGTWNTDHSRVRKGFEICYGLPPDFENGYWALDVLPGSECVIDGPCIKSHPTAGIERYMNHENCRFTAKKDGNLIATFFETEKCCDHVTIGEDEYDGKLGGYIPPRSISTGVGISESEYLLWDSNHRRVRGGFVICFEGYEGSGPFWSLEENLSGACVVDGRCIKSHEDAGVENYDNDERCLFQALQGGTLKAEYFHTRRRDRVTIGNHNYFFQGNGEHRSRVIRGRGMPLETTEIWPGTEVVWDTDDSVTKYGFEICYDLSGAGQGDPHFKLWSGDWFDFHGICDQVLTTSSSFGNGLGLDIHIRTKPRYQYSYIEATSIKIGEDVLEIGSWGQYWFNGVEGTRLPKMMAGMYPVEKVMGDKKQHKFVITLDEHKHEHIVVHVVKDLVNVNVAHATMGSFGDSSGLLGSFPDGIMLARNGSTVLDGHDVFGQEWQAMALDPILFQSTNQNQPEVGVCVPPVVSKGRRLGEGVSMDAAERACAHHNDSKMKDMCVFDVMAMGDLEMAGINGAF